MAVAILSLGTELTRGEIENGNATWLAARLTEMGHEVFEITTVDDDDDRIEQALRRPSQAATAIVSTGGLGPTTDDRTAACVARALDTRLILHPVALANVRAALAGRGRTLSPENEKQALLPDGARVLENALGTAPGFEVMSQKARAFFLPGVPSEMRAMFDGQVAPRLPEPEEATVVLHLRTFGLPESEIGARLAHVERDHGVTIGYRASAAGVAIKVLSRAPSAEVQKAKARAEAAWSEIQERLGEAVYSVSATPLEVTLGEALVQKGLSLALAESCTGGGASELLSRMPGASAYLRGAVVAYDNRVKASLLGVPQDLLDVQGAVSREVAEAMARGACRALGADVGISITGIAGPGGGTAQKPVGLVHWAVCYRNQIQSFQGRFSGTRTDIQRRAAYSALFAAWSILGSS